MRTPRQPSQHSSNDRSWSFMDARPAAQGMYDPRNEHDACGVGFVATLTGEASHTLVEQALTVLRNLEHRGATGSEPDSGDGAGILSQVPDAFFREVAGFELPEAGRTPSASPSCRRRAPGRPSPASRRSPPRSSPCSAGARSRSRRSCSAPPPAPPCRSSASSSSPTGSARHRTGPQGVRAAQARRARGGRLLPVAVRADHRLQGHADHRPARALLPRPVRPPLRLRDRAGALPVLHEHLPVVAARAPVPLRRAQR
ncbi:hypothetical protein STENM223S_03442 [Streptomyces tendae]